MAQDIIARALAAKGGGGGQPIDAYTKSETDTLLSKKENTIPTYTLAEYEAIKDTIPPGTKFIITDDRNPFEEEVENARTGADGIVYDDLKIRLDTEYKKLSEMELFKFPNATIIGSPTINNGQISGFSAENYMRFPFIVNMQGRPFVIDMAFTTGADITNQQNIIDGIDHGIAFAIRSGKFVLVLGSTSGNWDISQGEKISNVTVTPGTTYRVRISWDGSVYKFEYSTDGESYIEDTAMRVTSSLSLYPTQINIGVTAGLLGAFTGIINMNYCSLTISDKVVWTGMDDVGLATRMAVDMSNIDDAGVDKIEEVAVKKYLNDNHLVSNFGRFKLPKNSSQKIESIIIKGGTYDNPVGIMQDKNLITRNQRALDVCYNGTFMVDYSCTYLGEDRWSIGTWKDQSFGGWFGGETCVGKRVSVKAGEQYRISYNIEKGDFHTCVLSNTKTRSFGEDIYGDEILTAYEYSVSKYGISTSVFTATEDDDVVIGVQGNDSSHKNDDYNGIISSFRITKIGGEQECVVPVTIYNEEPEGYYINITNFTIPIPWQLTSSYDYINTSTREVCHDYIKKYLDYIPEFKTDWEWDERTYVEVLNASGLTVSLVGDYYTKSEATALLHDKASAEQIQTLDGKIDAVNNRIQELSISDWASLTTVDPNTLYIIDDGGVSTASIPAMAAYSPADFEDGGVATVAYADAPLDEDVPIIEDMPMAEGEPTEDGE